MVYRVAVIWSQVCFLLHDDTSLIASDRVGLKRSLDVLVKWCEEWGVKINVGKLGIMHMRKKEVERCEMEYQVDGEVSQWCLAISI